MPVELKVPSLGESITEVGIGEWHVKEGDWVAEDAPVVCIETDKANTEMPAPVSGRVTKIMKRAGDVAAVGDVIGIMEKEAAPAKADGVPPPVPGPVKEAPRVMPAARRAMAEKGVAPDQVTPSGPGGRILKEDVRKVRAPGARHEEEIRMTLMRKKTAERLVQAQRTAALLTTFNEVDMSRVIALRTAYKEKFQKKHGIKLGFMSFFVKASIEALKEFPELNGEIRDDKIVYRNYYDIGIAVGGGKGLVVPVLRNAERLSFAEVELQLADFAKRAAEGTLKLEELQGGTFTISNGGVYGSMLSTPIINPPQSGILGMHNIVERPVAINGQVEVRPVMYLALTYDHRIVDGREAVTFLLRVKERIEEPSRILLEI